MTASQSRGSARTVWILLFLFAVVRCWLMPLRSGFWLDETGTYFMVSGTWRQMVERVGAMNQSFPYCALIWVVSHLFGSREWILRMPSILASGVAAVLLYRLTARLANRSLGLTAALFFVALPEFAPLAYEARTYALCIAAVTASALFFVRWLQDRRRTDGVLCVLILAGSFYGHPTYALMGVVYALVLARDSLTRGRFDWAEYAAGAAAFAILCLPTVSRYRSAAGHAATQTSGLVGWADYFGFFPTVAAGVLTLGMAVLYLTARNVEWEFPPLQQQACLFFFVWAAIPPAILLLTAKFTPVNLFVTRYYSCAIPAMAVILAIPVCSVRGRVPRMTLVALVTVCFVAAAWSSKLWPSQEVDWRQATDILRREVHDSDAPIFVRSGFIEANSLYWLEDPIGSRFLLAPFEKYPLPGKLVSLPWTPSAGFDAYLEKATEGTASKKEFFVVIAERLGDQGWLAWFQSKYGATFRVNRLPPTHALEMVRFLRNE